MVAYGQPLGVVGARYALLWHFMELTLAYRVNAFRQRADAGPISAR